METVYAMGFSRQKALENLDSLSLRISEHFFKLFLLPKHQSLSHWEHELKTWRRALTRYNSPKGKTNNYNRATLKRYLFEEPLGLPEDLKVLKKMVEDEYKTQVKIPKEFSKKLESKMDEYITSILKNNDDWLD